MDEKSPTVHDLVVDARGGVRLRGNAEWSRTLQDAREEYGHDNVDLYVLDHLPITPAEKLAMYRMVLREFDEEKS
jgi:hypothetical protein